MENFIDKMDKASKDIEKKGKFERSNLDDFNNIRHIIGEQSEMSGSIWPHGSYEDYFKKNPVKSDEEAYQNAIKDLEEIKD